jgi:hypothetical protein
LLEELGVNFGHIKTKTLAVLNPLSTRRIDQHLMDDADLAGPVLFFIMFGVFLLFVSCQVNEISRLTALKQSGKVHFGYIYGLALLGSTTLWMIFSLMAPSTATSPDSSAHLQQPTDNHDHPTGSSTLSSSLTYSRSTSVLGYSILPLVIISLFGIVFPMDTFIGYALTSMAISWCTYSSSAIFCAVGRMREMRLLVAYPLALFYTLFGIMAIFSSRGSGALQAKVEKGL